MYSKIFCLFSRLFVNLDDHTIVSYYKTLKSVSFKLNPNQNQITFTRFGIF